MVRCPLAMVLALAVSVIGCVKEGGGKDASASKPTDAINGAPDTGSADAIMSCKDIRSCVFACREDQTCAARCVAAAPQAARGLYQQAKACSENACPTQDPDCRCMEECHGGGMCTEVVDECDEATSDPFCDGPCH
jgi:hypothetical protein